MAHHPQRDNEQYSEQETQRRAEAALRAAFNTPTKPQSEMKLGKPRGKRAASPKRKSGIRRGL
jgi:hypothetical protein